MGHMREMNLLTFFSRYKVLFSFFSNEKVNTFSLFLTPVFYVFTYNVDISIFFPLSFFHASMSVKRRFPLKKIIIFIQNGRRVYTVMVIADNKNRLHIYIAYASSTMR